ncbi:ATP-binding protein involved in chromosome partitioning [Novosphingobium hassiacum]|uniref:Iron-sulfur cluster carrier protein n=2 Tax=Novosphingobium hassiacum TaxID=173676 RepID=A0A7W5ZTL7_9SPHN|nr:ATP-binding protein involved in chromosome partitioning [Novosphingobium hassiacum]
MSIEEQTLREAVMGAAGDRLQSLKLADGIATIMLEVGGLERLDRDKLEMAVRDAARKAGAAEVRLGMTAERKARQIIAVGSGKGGVGKSTLSANLAVAMARLGRKVGLVDADIYGPSQPRLLSTEGRRPEAEGNKMIPVPSPYGVPMLSMGHLVEPGQAIAWRGPMAGKALEQLIDAHWGETEIIVVDLPPGTGDVQLSMLAKHKPAGAVIVSTPQDLALMDATRAIGLFEQAKVPLVGMVENMAGYICPHCGEESDPFGNGGAEAAARTMGLPFLGRIPLDLSIRQDSDAGNPPAAGDGPQAEAFASIARGVLAWLDGQR